MLPMIFDLFDVIMNDSDKVSWLVQKQYEII